MLGLVGLTLLPDRSIDVLENLLGLKPLPPDKPVLRLVKG